MQIKIEYLPVNALEPYSNNTRKHQDYDIGEIAKSISLYGFNDPIGIWSDHNVIVEGHGRVEAAKKLGLENVPCIRLDHLTDEQRKAYGIMHNKTAEFSSWVFFIGSMVAYYASQCWDVWVFHKIRSRFGGNSKMRWVWNNASTMTSQIIDTVIFIGISFGFGFGWFFNKEMHSTLLAMMVGQYVLKFVEAALDTPFFYLLTRKTKKEG